MNQGAIWLEHVPPRELECFSLSPSDRPMRAGRVAVSDRRGGDSGTCQVKSVFHAHEIPSVRAAPGFAEAMRPAASSSEYFCFLSISELETRRSYASAES